MRKPTRRNSVQDVAVSVAAGICTLAYALAVVAIFAALFNKTAPGRRDFVAYWASGELLARHADPYGADRVLALERAAGYPPAKPVMIMRNPPWALPLALPLGGLSAMTGEVIWTFLLAAAWVVSVRMVWAMHGRPANWLHWLGYSFGPALVCVLSGQAALFMLLGLVLFLRWNGSRPFLAGMALWLCVLKPHLFLPFGLVLAMWVVAARRYRLVLGLAVALGISSVLATILDPKVWMQYGAMLRSDRVAETVIPCVSNELRQAIPPHTLWVQLIPALAGCVWAVLYFRRHSEHWDWMEHGSALMLVSVVAAPYAWITDQSILIPALLHGLYRAGHRNLFIVLALASLAIEVGMFRGVQEFHSVSYMWTAPFWLAWYVWAISGARFEGEWALWGTGGARVG